MHRRSPGAIAGPFLLLLCCLVENASGQEPAREELAIAAGSRGGHAEAAAIWLRCAEALALAGASDRDAAVVEYCTGRALDQHRRAPSADDFDQRLDAMRSSPLATTHPLLRDRLGVTLLTWRAAVDHPGTGALAAELGFLTQFWICGPFANERGAGFTQDLPAQRGFDPDATWPGKQRAVSWRLLPAAGPSARFGLAQVLRPSNQSLALLAVALVCDAPTTAVLEIGSTDSWRVFLGGRELGAREVERTFAHDQDAVVLPLSAGPSLLVLKLCHQEGTDFQFAVRLRGIDGAPLRGVRATTDAATLRAAAGTRGPEDVAPARAAPPLGARTTFDADDPTGADTARLAWCWHLRGADGDRERRDQRLAERALAVRPTDTDLRLMLARTRVRLTAHDADRDENARRYDYEAILALDADHVPAAVELGHLLLHETGLRHQAHELARRALATCPQHTHARLLLADVQAAEGLEALARQTLIAVAVAADPATPPVLLRRAARAQRDGDDPAGALATSLRIVRRTGALEDRVTAADLLADAGRLDEATALLQAAMADDPFARRPRALLADFAAAAGRTEVAQRIWREWLAVSPDDAEAWVALSRLHALRAAAQEPDARQDQIECLRTALDCDPNLRAERRYLEFLAAADTPFYSEFQLDGDAVIAADPGPPADAAAARDPLHWVLRQDVIAAHRNGTTSHYLHWIVRIREEDGARRMASWSLPWYRGEQRARMLACVVRKADGTVQRPPLRGASVSLQTLRPGDLVELQGRVDDLAPGFFGDYFGLEHRFAAEDGSPVARSELVVIAAPGRDYRVRSGNGAPQGETTTRPDGTQVMRFGMQQLPREVPEPRQPSARERQPLVQITTMRDWDHFASWWWNLIRNQIEVTPAMRQKIAELTAGLTTTADKIAAVYHFVVTDVRYEAWEFGVHGYKPYATSVIFDRRHGDCKDKALLLTAMLGELGIPCRPVLIFADPLRSRDDLTLAMVQQFNHCIAWLPPHEGLAGRFLDGTATWHPPGTLPEMDQGARVLVVDAGRAELRDVPWTTPEQNTAHQEFAIQLREDGAAALQLRRSPTGNAAVPLRSAIGTEPARAREQRERELVDLFGKATLRDVVASDALRLAEPVQLTVTGEIAELGQRRDARWELPSVFGADHRHELAIEPVRKQPLLLGIPERDHRLLRYRLPPGWRPMGLPGPARQAEDFGSFAISWRQQGDLIEVQRTVEFTAPRIEPAAYPAFRSFVAALADADARLIVLTRENGR